jgi:hypothetical protein
MREQPYPFIYIASLPRTGSTLIGELLTQPPYAFIFQEPHLGKNYFALQENDVVRLKKYDVDLPQFVKYRLLWAFFLRRLRPFGVQQDYMVKQFKRVLMPQLFGNKAQIGVKEIRHQGWQNYLRHFPKMRVIMTGRDPRDLYISYFRKWQRGTIRWERPFTPQTVAQELNEQFNYQLAIKNATQCLTVRYEDLCSRPKIVEEIKQFSQSPIPTQGEVGAFISTHPSRINESEIHRKAITSQQVGRWRTETDSQLLADATTLFNLMPNYCTFWGFDEQPTDY